MKRAALALLLVTPIVLVNALLTAPARADCADELSAVRVELASVKDESRRQELQKLVEKAEKDQKAGRVGQCRQTVQRARILLK
jgi:hypothetical protein